MHTVRLFRSAISCSHSPSNPGQEILKATVYLLQFSHCFSQGCPCLSMPLTLTLNQAGASLALGMPLTRMVFPTVLPAIPTHPNLTCTVSHSSFSLWEMEPQSRLELKSMVWCDTVLLKFWTWSWCNWDKTNEKVLKSCGQGPEKSTMSLQDPRGQRDAAIMPNGKGQGRQEVTGPWGGTLVLGKGPPGGAAAFHGGVESTLPGGRAPGKVFLAAQFSLLFVSSRPSWSSALPFPKSHLLPLAGVDFYCLPLRILIDNIVFTCLHALSNVTHPKTPYRQHAKENGKI